jgi:hypothetical protein
VITCQRGSRNFLFVNVTYIALWRERVQRSVIYIPKVVHRMMNVRSLVTLTLFAIATAASLRLPAAGLILIVSCLVLDIRPDPAGPNTETPPI